VAEGDDCIVTFRVASNDTQIWDDEGSDAIAGPGEARTLFAMPDGIRLDSANFAASNRIIFRADRYLGYRVLFPAHRALPDRGHGLLAASRPPRPSAIPAGLRATQARRPRRS
jgi:hypothetical protein